MLLKICHLLEGLYCAALILITSNYTGTIHLMWTSFSKVFLMGCFVKYGSELKHFFLKYDLMFTMLVICKKKFLVNIITVSIGNVK